MTRHRFCFEYYMHFTPFFKNAFIPCLACKTYFHKNFDPPFCHACRASLYRAPLSLCTACLTLCEPGAHPFLKPSESERMNSIHAEYWLVGQSFEVAKAWKKKTGFLSNRALFQWREETLISLKSIGLTHLVPLPQRLARMKQLRGKSPAFEIAQSLSHTLSLPLLPLLQLSLENEIRGQRQSRLSQEGRIQMRDRFEVSDYYKNISQLKILLVDDFATTGHTLRLAVRALKQVGIQEVHCFCLGIRPRFSRSSL